MLNGCFWAGFCVYIAFLVVFLSSVGYDNGTIGIIIALTAVGRIIASPIFGYLSDFYIASKRIVIICFATAIPFGFVLMNFHNIVWVTFLSVFIVSTSIAVSPTLIDSWTIGLRQTKPYISYSLVRGVGSFTYAVVAVIAGVLFETFSIELMFPMLAFFMLCCITIALFIEEVPPHSKKEIAQNKAVEDDGISNAGFIPTTISLLKRRNFAHLTFCATIMSVGVCLTRIYFPVFITAVGGTSTDFGLGLFIMAVAEVPVMFAFNRFLSRYNMPLLLLISYALTVLRGAFMLTVFPLPFVLAIQVVFGLSTGLYMPSTIEYVNNIVPQRIRATAICAFYVIAEGSGTLIGSTIGGFVADGFGVFASFRFAFAVSLLATLLFLPAVFTKRKGGENNEPSNA